MFTLPLIRGAVKTNQTLKRLYPGENHWGRSLRAEYAARELMWRVGRSGTVVELEFIKKSGEKAIRRAWRVRRMNTQILFKDIDDGGAYKSFQVWQLLDEKFQPKKINNHG